jgi:hypothetical protein
MYGIVEKRPCCCIEKIALYLSIQHHGLFSPIICMRPGTTLSVYATSWFLLTNPMHEIRNHSICLYNIMVSSHQSHTWEQGPLYLSKTMVLYRQIEWSLISCMELVRRDHGVVYSDRVVPVLLYGIGEKRPCLSIQHHGLFSPIPYMRPGTTLSVYTTSWSLLTNPIHETRDHSICLYNIMVSSHQSHTWDMMLYRQIKWFLFSCMELVRRDHDVV